MSTPAHSSAPSPRTPRPLRNEWLRDEASVAGRLLVLLAAVLAALWVAQRLEIVTIAAFLGFAQAALLWPVVRRLAAVMPRALATLLTVLVYLAAIGALAWFIGARLVAASPMLIDAVAGGVQTLGDWLDRSGFDTPGMLDSLERELRARAAQLTSGVGSAALTTVSALGTFVTILVLALFLTVFALITGPQFWASIRSALPRRRREQGDSAFRAAFATARGWLYASTLTGLVDGLLIGAGLWVLDVPLALPIGALTFIAGFIPTLGATAAGALAVIVALFAGGPTTALWALLVVLVVQQVEGNVLSPLLLSRAMSFNPIITMLLTTAGGLALGLTGLFLAVPVVGCLTAAINAWRRSAPADEDRSEAPATADASG